jgi:hypothetical protein
LATPTVYDVAPPGTSGRMLVDFVTVRLTAPVDASERLYSTPGRATRISRWAEPRANGQAGRDSRQRPAGDRPQQSLVQANVTTVPV